MEKLVSESQSAFLQGRQILDGIVTINEIIEEAKHKKKECIIFKADFQRAFDSVDWGFLDYMMSRLGFCEKWRKWIRECLQSATVAVLINGSPSKEFRPEKGLRQGDPLSPLLFLIVVEGLSGLISKAIHRNMLRGFKIGGLTVSHLQYADDTLVIGEASPSNVFVMKAIMSVFELASGLKVNFSKSKLIGVNVAGRKMEELANIVQCKVEQIPFKYLGIMAGANPGRISTWQDVIEKVRGRLASWNSKFLSAGGRLILTNAVLSSIPIYYLSIYKAPAMVIKKLNSLMGRFLWGGGLEKKGIHWVNWEEVCRSRNQGGLGVKNLEVFNKVLIAKWRWRLLHEGGGLWKKVLLEKYRNGISKINGAFGHPVGRYGSRWWRDLVELVEEELGYEGWFFDKVERKVGNGQKTRFWLDKWVGERTLKESFPRLFSIARKKEALVAEMGDWSSGIWVWKTEFRRRINYF